MKIIVTGYGKEHSLNCDASIPLYYVHSHWLSRDAITLLAKQCLIQTIEEFVSYPAKQFQYFIKNKTLHEKILYFHGELLRRRRIHKNMLSFLRSYLHVNIRLSEIERQKIIGLFLFSHFLQKQIRDDKGSSKQKLLALILPELEFKGTWSAHMRSKKVKKVTLRSLRQQAA